MRLGRKISTWEDAKADCEERGERMLILETAAKSTWVVNQLNVIGSSGSLLSSGRLNTKPMLLLIHAELSNVFS